jgi:hypothetical protein
VGSILKKLHHYLRRMGRRFLQSLVQAALPKPILHAWIRGQVHLPTELSADLQFKIAETREELESAYKILHDAYVDQGFTVRHASGLYLSLQHALPSTITLVAKLRDQVIGTATLIRDNPLGLPLERAFACDRLNHLRREGGRVAEISCLVIHRDFRRQYGGQVLFPLFSYLYRYAFYYYGVDHFTIAIFPKHACFYESLFGFQPLERRKTVKYLGAPAAALHLDLHSAPLAIANWSSNLEISKNVFRFFVERNFPQFQFPKRPYGKISDPVMTPELLDYFFNRKTVLFESLNNKSLQVLRKRYQLQEFQRLLPVPKGKWSPYNSHPDRFEVKMNGWIESEAKDSISSFSLQITNVSQTGFCGLTQEQLTLGATFTGWIAVNTSEKVSFRATPVWRNDYNQYGFKIVSTTAPWNHLIQYLSDDLYSPKREAV